MPPTIPTTLTSPPTPPTTTTTTTKTIPQVLFTDLDGTLIHYPSTFNPSAKILSTPSSTTAILHYPAQSKNVPCHLLPSSHTGSTAYISVDTLNLLEKLRNLGVIIVVITGARSSTYLKRRVCLHEADFEFWENGGRMMEKGVVVGWWSGKRLAEWVDVDGKWDWSEGVVRMGELEERKGKLWEACRTFVGNGWKVDYMDYATNFRVDVKGSHGKCEEDFKREVQKLEPLGLVSTYNLGKADVYPRISGKANAAKYVLETLKIEKRNAVAMFDDDNDLELGRLCGRSFLPGVTHPSVLKAVEENGSWTVTDNKGPLGTEEALMNIIALREEQ